MDFAWPEARLAIEVDGWKWHSSRRAWIRDGEKANYLQARGWIVLRFSWDEITKEPEKVLAEVRGVLLPRLFDVAQGS